MSSIKSDVDDNQSKSEDEGFEMETADRLEAEDIEKTPSEHGDNESVAPQTRSVKREIEYGLLPEDENSGDLALDVITVHSICPTSWSTEYVDGDWNPNQGPKGSTEWLRNLFRSSRVLHYHYKVECTDYIHLPDVWIPGGIEREAQKLLDAVLKTWEANPPRKNPRPIVFVGHDIGGIIIKKALVFASLNPTKYKDILYYNSTLVFLGCPHRNSRLELEDSFARLLSLPPDTFTPRANETATTVASTTERINAEFLDTKAFLRAITINISSQVIKFSDYTHIPLPNPFWIFSCLANIPYEQGRAWNVPHLRLIEDGDGSTAFANTFSRQLGQHPFTMEPEPRDAPVHKFLISQSPPMVPWKMDEFMLLSSNSKHWIAKHEEYLKWLNSSGLGILHLRCPKGFTRILSHTFYRNMANDPRENNLFHIFSRRDDRCNSLQSLFANLNCQLVGRYSEAFNYSFCWTVLASQEACTAQDLAQLFSSYRRGIHLKTAVYFICCLNECDETRYKLVEILNEICRHSEQPARFVVTTTKGCDERLESQLASFHTIDVKERMEQPEEQILFTREMEKLVDGQVRRLMCIRPAFFQCKDRFDQVLTSCLPDRQLACFAIRWLADNTLTRSNRSSIRKILDRLTPLNTETLITVILESFGDRAARVRKMILWIKFAFEIPTLRELGEALYVAADMHSGVEGLEDIDYDELNNDILQFGGLITFDGHQVDLFRPDSFPSDDAGTVHAEMASICLNYLVLPEVWEKLEDVIEKNALLDEAPVSRPRHSLVCYASKFWTKHYRLAGEHRPKEKALELFKNPKARNLWAQAVYVLSNPMCRIAKGYISALPVVSSTGLEELVTHQLDVERRLPVSNTDFFAVDVGLSIVEAARNAHKEVVQLLLEATVPTNSLLTEALLAAAASGDETTIHHLVGVAANITEFDWPPGLFRRVAWLGLVKTAKLLLALNVPLPPFDGDGIETSLVNMAIEGSHPEMAKILIEAKAEIETTKNYSKMIIHSAARRGNVDVIQSVLAVGADKDAEDQEDEEASAIRPLHTAVLGANPQAIRVLLEAGADANVGGDHSWMGRVGWAWSARPLVYAAMSGYTECVRVLLEHDVDVNAKLDGKNALWHAASMGHIEICRQLLKYGADANESTKDSEPLLIAAVTFSVPSERIIELLQLLIEHEINLEVQDESQTWRNNVLSRAVGTSNKEVVELLLAHDVPTNMGAEISQTPLYVAAHEGNAELVRLLLDHEADPNVKSEWNWAPLHAAYDNPEITELLLKAGADVDAVCDSGTASYLAAKHNQHDVLKLLLDHTKKPDLEIETLVLSDGGGPEPDEDGMTALCIACQRASVECIELLLDAGADINHQTKDGSFPMKYCLTSRYKEPRLRTDSIELLLKYQSKLVLNPNLTDKSGNTILHNIDIYTTYKTIGLLCRAGADVNATNPQGETPLLRAVYSRNIVAFKALWREGANVKICSPTKGTLLHTAARSGQWELFQEVQAAGCDVGVARSLGFKETLLYSLAIGKLSMYSRDKRQIAEYLVEEAKQNPDEESPDTTFGFPILAGLFSTSNMVTNYLIAKGANLDVKDAMGRTPLHLALMTHGLPDGTVKALLKKGADATARTKIGLLPVHFAAAYPASATALRQLLKHIEDPKGYLDDAEREDDDAGSVDVRSNDSDETRTAHFKRSEPPTQTTARDGDLAFDKKSTDGKPPFDIDFRDDDGWTPLMWSVKDNYNSLDCPNALLERGASLWAVAEGPGRKWSPLKVSRYYGSANEVLELLTPKEKTRTLPDGTTEVWRDEDHQERMGDLKDNWDCDHCLMKILGKRYRCLECEADSFNMCYKCVGSKDVLHPNHRFEAMEPEYEDVIEEPAEGQKPDDAEKKPQVGETGEGEDDEEENSDLDDDNDLDTNSDDD